MLALARQLGQSLVFTVNQAPPHQLRVDRYSANHNFLICTYGPHPQGESVELQLPAFVWRPLIIGQHAFWIRWVRGHNLARIQVDAPTSIKIIKAERYENAAQLGVKL